MGIKKDHKWFVYYVETILEEVEKGERNEKEALNSIKKKHNELFGVKEIGE